MTQEFKDHVVQHPNRFKRVPVAGTTDQFDLIPTWVENPSEVVQVGTPIDRQLFEGFSAQLAEKVTKETAHYFVGANQKYKTIGAAYNAWVTDGKPHAIIKIMKGVYNEALKPYNVENKLSFIGESKHDVLWHTTRGYYQDGPLHVQNAYIKNITFIADHSDNPGFVPTTLSGAGSVWNNLVGCAYALHIDFSGAGKTVVEDCDLISYQNAALGSGTRKDQTIELINVNMYSYSAADTIPEIAHNGGMLYHTAAEAGQTNQLLKMKNVNVFSEHFKAMEYDLNSSEPGVSKVEMINNNFHSNAVTGEDRVRFDLNGRPNYIQITTNSYGNNVQKCNKNTSSTTVSDANLALENGIYLSEAGANLPTAASYTLDVYSANSLYKVQYAIRLTDGVRYKRVMNNGVWGAWSFVAETEVSVALGGHGVEVSDANLAAKSGYYYCANGLNVPNAATFMIHTISLNNLYKVQYAWRTDGLKYKRNLNNGTWSAWSQITEP